MQSIYEFTVRNPVLFYGSAYFHLPEASRIALAKLSTLKRIRPSVQKRVFGETFFGLSPPLEALGVFEKLLSSFVGNYTSFNSCH